MTTTAFVLIALLKTAGEGGVFQRDYADYDSCMEAGRTLREQFEDLPFRPRRDGTVEEGGPQVLFTCFEAPVQPDPKP